MNNKRLHIHYNCRYFSTWLGIIVICAAFFLHGCKLNGSPNDKNESSDDSLADIQSQPQIVEQTEIILPSSNRSVTSDDVLAIMKNYIRDGRLRILDQRPKFLKTTIDSLRGSVTNQEYWERVELDFQMSVEQDSLMTLTVFFDGGYSNQTSQPTNQEEYTPFQPTYNQEMKIYLDQLLAHFKKSLQTQIK